MDKRKMCWSAEVQGTAEVPMSQRKCPRASRPQVFQKGGVRFPPEKLSHRDEQLYGLSQRLDETRDLTVSSNPFEGLLHSCSLPALLTAR